MPKGYVMPDCCLLTLAKLRELFNLDILIEFPEPWHGVDKYTKEILICLQKNSPLFDNNPHFDLLFKAEQKATLQTFRNSKKQKNMDDPLIAEKAQMVSLRD